EDDGDTLTYSITGGNDGGAFAIDDEGNITVADSSALDFETQAQFQLDIRVADNGNPVGEDTTTVTIDVNDVNEAPIFLDDVGGEPLPDGESLTADLLPETAVNNDAVITLEATDDDVGDQVTYTIVTGNESGAFAIDSDTGEITVADADQIDADINPSFTLTVQARDNNGALSLTDQVEVIVNIGDVNQAPVIEPIEDLDVDENSPIGTLVGTVTATDEDDGDTLTYSIISGNENGIFAIDTGTGDITVADSEALDFETQSQFFLEIGVLDNGNPVGADDAPVTITVNDLNEAPVFVDEVSGDPLEDGEPLIADSIFETAVDGDTVITVLAEDDDAGDLVAYSIVAGNESGAFTIDSETGIITIANADQINSDITSEFTLTVQAVDNNGGQSLADQVDVIVDVINVNQAPEFDPVDAFSIDENSAVDTVVGTISATDADVGDTLTFSIISGNDNEAFAIDPTSGQITVANSDAIDAETQPQFELEVQVTDDGSPFGVDTATVTIDIEEVNEAPIFLDAPGGSPLPDGESLIATPIPEGTANDELVITVEALDDDVDDTVSYGILSGNEAGAFAIDSDTGEITIADADAINFNTVQNFTLVVQARDNNGAQSLADEVTVVIDVADVNQVPVIEPVEPFDIDENAAEGAAVGTISATDADVGDTLTFAITSGNDNGAFAIDPASGEITVANSDALDAEVTGQFDLEVQVTDNGSPFGRDTATVTITINEINEAPVFLDAPGGSPLPDGESLTVDALPEAVAIDDPVITVEAIDEDADDTVSYGIVSGNESGAFAIDSETGEITVANPDQINADIAEQFNLIVQARDNNGASSLADEVNVVIDVVNVNQNPEIEPAGPFEIEENTPEDTVVGTVMATDPDAGDTLTFSIISGNDNGAFAIDPASGQITVANSDALNAEVQQQFQLEVQVTDNGSPFGIDTATVTIDIEEVNEAPIFLDEPGGDPLPDSESITANPVSEAATNGASVITVEATDDDADDTVTYGIASGNESGAFAIDDGTGEITIADAEQINFNTVQSFNLIVQARDNNGAQSLADEVTVVIDVEDVNQDPVIDPVEPFEIDDNVPVNTVVGTVSATDPDEGDTLTFAITDGNDDDAFTIDPASGEITVVNSDALEAGQVQLEIEVTDNGAPSGSATTIVTIDINDVNDAPVINDEQNNTAFFFVTTSGSNTFGDIIATDPDGDNLTYEVVGGTGEGIFDFADPNSPTLELADEDAINLEFPGRFTLTVRATDDGEGNLASEDVELQIFVTPLQPNVRIIGEGSNDVFEGTTGIDLIFGDDGNDELSGAENDDVLSGEDGNDMIIGDDGNDQLFGGKGDDQITGKAGDDIIYGQTGNDTLGGGQGDDQLFGNGGDDRLEGKLGNDSLEGGNGNDRLLGQDGDDILVGVNPESTGRGLGELDVLKGGEGADTLILGDENGAFYDDGDITNLGIEDHARLNNLDAEDTIVLAGSIGDYQFSADFALDDRVGTGIFFNGEFIALAVDISVDDTISLLSFV
ncbi:MAG: cadherin domain-containing protein, partial [Cyanobacteria bacterium P01_F01_bin.86]